MNKEEIEELKDFTIDITDIDELALGLEVCSKKSNMVIQEFANLIIELQQENKQLKKNWNMLKEYLKSETIFLDSLPTLMIRANEHKFESNVYKKVLEKIQELEKGDSNE